MRSSIGSETPESRQDRDRDGAPDQSEADFARDGEVARPTPPRPTGAEAGPPAGAPPGKTDDDGLESTRPPHGNVLPPPPN